MTKLEQALVDVARFLVHADTPYMVIGGFANLVWGTPRTTQDIDITVLVEDESIPALIGQLASCFHVLPAEPVDFVRQTRVLPLATSTGVRLDLIFASLPYEERAIQRSRVIEILESPVRICSPEDLIIHKMISERPRDREDVEGVFRRQGSRLDFSYLDPIIRDLAEALARQDILVSYERMKQAST